MTPTKLTLSTSRDIPFNKLVLSQANVRRIKAGLSIEQLAEDIARRTLLQSLTVRPILDGDGSETGLYDVPVGGRRYRALELLVKQKRLARNAPVPCVIRTDGLAAEDSLAENLERAPLHPLDQFRAFQTLREAGLGDEDIAARFFVTPVVVRQRLRLVTVSPKLLDLYAEDQITLDQVMAFSVTSDHARQEQVWDSLVRAYNREPYYIRKLLTEGTVRAADKRVRFVGIEAYEAAGGVIQRDLFEPDGGGWLQDPALLDRLVSEKLAAAAETVRAEGWKWIEVAPDFPYGHTARMRRLIGTPVALTEADQAERDQLQAEYDRLIEAHAGADAVPEEIERRVEEIGIALAAFDDRPLSFDPAEILCAGVFVSIDGDGNLRVDRGYVRPEDEPMANPVPVEAVATIPVATVDATTPQVDPVAEPPEEDEGLKPLPDRLVAELTAHRTLALRDALARAPDVAFLAVLHVLCLQAFYRSGADSALDITAHSPAFTVQPPGLADTAPAKATDARHQTWLGQLPADPADLWDTLTGFDGDSQGALFAHCAALTVNAVREPWTRRGRALDHADHLARAVELDMAAAGWVPTVDTYLGRVTKARILDAVREAKGAETAQLIDHLKKPDMAREAERLLTGTGWLPDILRAPEPGPEPESAPDDLAQVAA
ncbi:ParB/RepB/Spo0J family partition protein [Phaeospirillum tilakii]|uniref:ParB/RepB/Spo0J family partition protein n=1 Tax=Phaeospirillum tilakii TaxID=741673 RepID=A0ABW5CFT6_9PROT